MWYYYHMKRDIVPILPRLLCLKKTRFVTLFPFISLLKRVTVVTIVGVLLLNLSPAQAPSNGSLYAAENEEDTESSENPENNGAQTQEELALERKELEEELLELEEQMAEQQQVINEYRAQGKTLKSEMWQIDAQINKLNLQIKAVALSLKKLDNNIYETQRDINRTQNQISEHKEALSLSIRNLYEADNQTLIAILLQNEKISDFFNNINDLLLIQDNIRLSLNDITSLRQELLEQKQELGLEKEDVESLKRIRENTKGNLQVTQTYKANLLETTKNKESVYQKLLAETQKTAAEIRSRIFRLIGGGELTFEKAYEFARLAEGSTGIRAALTLAILDRESLLGKNVGRCSYETAMHPTRDIPVFKKILETLNIEPGSTVARVSCPNQHGTYGGAMGPAQFIPSTWAIYGGYRKNNSGQWYYDAGRDYIGEVTGSKPSNPWSNADAFTATSLYIKDLYNSSSCRDYGTTYKHLLPQQTLQERCAAAKYYSGKRWWTYRFWYGDAVVTKAESFQKDIDILRG